MEEEEELRRSRRSGGGGGVARGPTSARMRSAVWRLWSALWRWSRLELSHSEWVYWEPELMLCGSLPILCRQEKV